MSETTDMVVMDQAVRDKEDFASLYAAHWQEVYRFAYFYLGSREDAEDAVQETFLRALQGFPRLRDRAKFKSWLFTILVRVCKRRVAGLIARRQEANVEDFPALPDSDVPDTALTLTLREELARMNRREQQILWLGAVAGYHSREIAQVLRIPAGTVRSQLSRALAKLRERLGEDCFG